MGIFQKYKIILLHISPLSHASKYPRFAHAGNVLRWVFALPASCAASSDHVTSPGPRDVTGSLLGVSAEAFHFFMEGGTCRWRCLSPTFSPHLRSCWKLIDNHRGHWLWRRRAAEPLAGQTTSELMSCPLFIYASDVKISVLCNQKHFYWNNLKSYCKMLY